MKKPLDDWLIPPTSQGRRFLIWTSVSPKPEKPEAEIIALKPQTRASGAVEKPEYPGSSTIIPIAA